MTGLAKFAKKIEKGTGGRLFVEIIHSPLWEGPGPFIARAMVQSISPRGTFRNTPLRFAAPYDPDNDVVYESGDTPNEAHANLMRSMAGQLLLVEGRRKRRLRVPKKLT